MSATAGHANPAIAPDGRPAPSSSARLSPRILIVEDDDANAALVADYLAPAIPGVSRVATFHEARRFLADVPIDCVILDLTLPDIDGFDAVREIHDFAPDVAVVVLTDDGDEHGGMTAMAAGAQDYLVRTEIDAPLLVRAVRYAAERKRTEASLRALQTAQARQRENVRLQRGLLPVPLLGDAPLAVVTRYRPRRALAQLGGDFFDAIQTDDGRVWLLIGDVSGHGPDEAALGVCLRVGWRALVLAGLDADHVLPAVQELLLRERHGEEVFASACMVVLDRTAHDGWVYLAGHPAPLVLRDGRVETLDVDGGVALGILDDPDVPATPLTLGPAWSLLCFTDGLIEGYADGGTGPRLGERGLVELVQRYQGIPEPAMLLDTLLDEVTDRNGGPLADDVAVLYVQRRIDTTTADDQSLPRG
ncbi:response regulator receiver modulated serine phosphatase [Acidothermus cellulolyticus 11B]|uniref:Response regulator receiver modulated serine phosphatase n=1 Tax=Acidothermus cellulolyticus (strain ATCC 43068 / DSM 8971 / 11B) TaxID=351607 RepID=A0LQX2_ACIC1|nr:fused response regulator/phosphatase [Acidothermus cellulolyticus]ABK51832.1 response regulator receiver modulated serine phosphatase [Acidothermus cellulolyticus 11B]